MNILGISYGHNATVALVAGGKLVFCQSEERFNRIKNSTGFPSQTLEFVYKHICLPKDIDKVIIFQKTNRGYLFEKKFNFRSFQYGNYLSHNEKFHGLWKNSWLRWKFAQIYFRNIIEKSNNLTKKKIEYYSSKSKQSIDKIEYLDHHKSHAYSVYGGISKWKKTLIFTLDAQGDYKCATVSIKINNSHNFLYNCDYAYSIGTIFAATTSLLGMKQGEHEFKVMGLAPYATKTYYKEILNNLKKLLFLNNRGEFKSNIPPNGFMNYLSKIYRNQRFDNIAGALQEFTEDLVMSWIDYWSIKKKCHNIALSGGVFMNVKLCQKIMEKKNTKNIFVMPSAGDESAAIGAAYWGSIKYNKKHNIKPLEHLYLGINYKNNDIEKVINKIKSKKNYKTYLPKDINLIASDLLSKGEIVARFSGAMEFGARALGNRSILANPSKFDAIEKINSSIKIRDFWMPFTPSILEEDIQKYIVNPKKIFAPYMSITFATKPLAHIDLAAAIHPRDKTIRPQCVKKEWNPIYYDLIKKFKIKTGISALLNTSFNLHGEPNVCSPEDAVSTFERSGLRYLILEKYLIIKVQN